MFGGVVEQVREIVRELDPARVSGPDAVRLMEAFGELKRLASTGEMLLAARAVETNQWPGDGDRSAEHWLARRTGTTYGAARVALETSARVKGLPATEQAMRDGRLSAERAALVAQAATADPDAEAELLTRAPHESVRELQSRVERVLAAARTAEEEQEREAAIRRNRTVKVVDLPDGSAELRARGNRADIALLRAHLQPWIDEQFTLARKEGRRDELGAYAFDGLMAMAAGSRGAKTKSPVKVILRADVSAIQRGTTVKGETCEIAGVGAIPVTEARKLLPDAFLAVVITNGKQVLNVTHFGRQFTAFQETAMEWASPECDVVGCHCAARLEKDHNTDWAKTRRTRSDDGNRLCHFHHGLKTRYGYRLEPGTGKRRLLPPNEQVSELPRAG